eukprot:10282780-Prorocentrum_lima.AAC.1
MQFLNSIFLTTATLECGFSRIKRWLHPAARPPRISAIASKIFLHEFNEDWAADLPHDKLRTKRKRPLWIGKRFAHNGLHCFIKAECANTGCSLHDARCRWFELPVADKEQWGKRARHCNSQSKAVRHVIIKAANDSFQDESPMGPWGRKQPLCDCTTML